MSPNDIQGLKAHIDTRLDKLEGKLDDHMQRITKVETEVSFLRGSIKYGLTIVVTIVGSIVSYFMHK